MRSIIILTALIFLGIGIALGTWVIPEDEGPSARCITVKSGLEQNRFSGDRYEVLVDFYDAECR